MSKYKGFYYLTCGACCAFMALAMVVGPKAQIIDHSEGFADHSDLTANRDATFPKDTTVARLTEAIGDRGGSIFTNNRVCTNSFVTSFTFKIGPPPFPPAPMADGMTFTIQNDDRGANAIGSNGGGLAYGRDFDADLLPAPPPATIANSVAIKFDVWNNHSETENSTGLYTNGRTPTVAKGGWTVCDATGCNPLDLPDTLVVLDKRSVEMGGSGIDLRSTHVFQADLSYDGTTLTETLTDTENGASITVTYPINLGDFVGKAGAFVGFTGATGGVTARQDVITWTYQCPAPKK